MSSKSKAQKIIQSIVKSHGFVSEESLVWMGSMRPEVRREVEEALLAKDKKIGSSVLALAKNLYSSKARFIFELLQNADDNKYEEATRQNAVPYVSFKLFYDRIVVECNEDGFTRANLQAICDVGQSSKSGSHGYIGEKGIGFKSVFMAAWKVHIQSGDFSFCFFHRKGDSGMGMVMPNWEEPQVDLPRPLTRITLFLQEDPSQREFIETQLRELQDTFLLFLRNLRRIDIAFHDPKGQQTASTSLNIRQAAESNRVILSNVSTGPSPNDSVHKSQIYHVTPHTVRNLPRSDNREEYSPAEESNKAWTSSTVVLAFPLTENFKPMIAPQDIFAFLPVTCKGFKFIIQADFDTQANRQDIMTSSQRNAALLRGVADTFVEAVLQFCEHETLQYRWMRYLPIEHSYPWDSFWRKLVDSIAMQLKVEPVLRSRTRNRLNRISDLKRRPNYTNDGKGEPLFADLPSELYLSDSYKAGDLDILEKFGLGTIVMDEIVQLLKHDLALDRVNKSKMKGRLTSDEWHSRAAALLQRPGMDWSRRMQNLRQLELIPLRDDRWVAATIGTIYFPSTDEAPIPGGLDLMLVHPDAAKNEKRAHLFRHLGVTRATSSTIRKRILTTYGTKDGVELKGKITRDISTEHWRFLYLTQHAASKNESLTSVRIWDHLGAFDPVGDYDYYLPDNDPNGPQTILGEARRGLMIYLIDECYLKDPPDRPAGSRLTWTQWLHNCAGIRRHLRLVNEAKEGLSGECSRIAEKHPKKFLGWLKSVWPEEGHLVCANSKIWEALRSTEVRCLGSDSKTECLKFSWLPASDLQAPCQRFLTDSFFPFLELPSGEEDDSLGQWSFLTKDLEVGIKDDLDFRLAMLRYFNIAHDEISCKLIMIRVVGLYNYIEASWLEAEDAEGYADQISDRIEGLQLLLLPSPDGSKADWTGPSDCLWDAPRDMTTKHPLQVRYAAAFADTDVDLERLARFFHKVLDIGDISCDDIIEELRSIKSGSSVAGAVAIRGLYERLQGAIDDEDDGDMIESFRQTIESEALLYVLQNAQPVWLKPSECIWSTTTQIHGKVAINFQYEGLKSLFVDKLLVKTVDVDMIYNELLGVTSRQPPATVNEIKELLMNFNSFIASGAHPPPPIKLLQRKIFPVKWPQGKVDLASAKLEFAVIDRAGTLDIFRNRVRTLDFSLREVCRLRPFITWSGLEERYLSKTVKEVSCIEGRESHAVSPTRDIKKKAYGLLRIAASYNSPRFDGDAEGLYDILRSALTVETEGISARLALDQDEERHEIELSKSDLHIEGDNGQLKIYVPRDEVAQDVCFKSRLPRRLAQWLMYGVSVEDSLVQVINAVLDCRIAAVNLILEAEGIPGINIADRSVNDIPRFIAEQAPATQRGIPRTPERRLSPELARGRHVSGGETPGSTSSLGEPTAYDTPLTDVDENYFPAIQSTPTNRILRFKPVSTAADVEYRKMLETIVFVARATEFPEHDDETGTFGMARMLSTLPSPEDDSMEPIPPFGRTDFEGRAMIGAAGELFVFEVLSNLDRELEGFCLESWQSTIRTHVNAHPDYAELSRWSGRETSDIVYDDVSGTFTNLLIEKGYLPRMVSIPEYQSISIPEYQWENKTPRYYIEVKSTTGQCDTPFFMSHGQYERMQKCTNNPFRDGKQSEVYVVFRVYNLGKPNMAVKVYVDPEWLRSEGKLRFTTDKWTVVPSVPAEPTFP